MDLFLFQKHFTHYKVAQNPGMSFLDLPDELLAKVGDHLTQLHDELSLSTENATKLRKQKAFFRSWLPNDLQARDNSLCKAVESLSLTCRRFNRILSRSNASTKIAPSL